MTIFFLVCFVIDSPGCTFFEEDIEQGRSQDFSKEGSHCVKNYRHGDFATEYCRLFAYKRPTKGGSRAPQDPPPYALATPASLIIILLYNM